MRITLSLVLAAAALGAGLPAAAQPREGNASARIVDAKGKEIGSATFRQGANTLVMDIKAQGLPPGTHGLHLHKVGICNTADAFKSAAGHVHGGTAAKHGLLNPEGPEWGDLPNIIVSSAGTVDVELATNLVRLTGENGLIDSDGSSIVIHAQPDDHISQPIGGAGDRIACGVIKAR